jgi:hypothetical protein
MSFTGPTLWILVTALLFFWLRDRKRLSQTMRELSGKQAQTQRAIDEFIEEMGKITQQFSRLLPATKSFQNGASEPRYLAVEKKHFVRSLAQKGHSVKEIAERLMLPSGEVELILNLDRTTTRVSA